jgi:hypothetical protein
MADLTDAKWEWLAPLIPVPPCRPDGKGRPCAIRAVCIAAMQDERLFESSPTPFP